METPPRYPSFGLVELPAGNGTITVPRSGLVHTLHPKAAAIEVEGRRLLSFAMGRLSCLLCLDPATGEVVGYTAGIDTFDPLVNSTLEQFCEFVRITVEEFPYDGDKERLRSRFEAVDPVALEDGDGFWWTFLWDVEIGDFSVDSGLVIRTQRLLLRQWMDRDRDPFAAMNADPEVMAYFPSTQSREESDASVDRVRGGIADRGWGFWAVELLQGGPFIGFVGLTPTRQAFHFTPCVEVGWRLARPYWGRGYATEAGRASLAFGFDELGLEEIVAFAVADNFRSRRVMERLGMSYDPAGDFDHPAFPEGHRYRRHVLYRKRRPG